MDACQACSNFFHIAVFQESAHLRTFTLEERVGIKESAQSCQLCGLILTSLEKYNEASDCNIFDHCNKPLKIWTFPFYSSLKVDENRISRFRWILLNDDYPFWNSIRFDCTVWADQCDLTLPDDEDSAREGVPSPSVFVDWPSAGIHHDRSEMASITQRFLNNCLEHHSSCRLSITEPSESTELPSRVVSIQNDAGVLSAKLLETKGLKGIYCALSHCWGPKEKQPLRTTRENIRNHLHCIPWSRLPCTFRDAINLVNALGFKYLWVDSLCIIQDDSKDWESEAGRMASVYRNAVLVIAAANSKDSTEGLIGPKLRLPSTFRCPITVHSGSDQSIHRAKLVQYSQWNISDYGEPLRERAWAFQEWYLRRRIVFFTWDGISWDCKEETISSDGIPADPEFSDSQGWLRCLSQYSEKKLTIPSDRIIALLGIVADLHKTRDDSFATELGVWEHGLAEQLLWKHVGVPREDFPSLPSWSWAATEGVKDWVALHDEESFSTAVVKDTLQTITLTQSGSLAAYGLLIGVTTTPSSCFQPCCFAELGWLSSAPEFRMKPGNYGEKDHAERFPMHRVGDKHSILGIGVFDSCAYAPECFCFILSFQKRNVDGPYYYVSGSEGSENRSSEHVDSESQGSEHGDDEHGDDEHGDSEYGDFEPEGSKYRGSEQGETEYRDYGFGDPESGGSESTGYGSAGDLITRTVTLDDGSGGADAKGSGSHDSEVGSANGWDSPYKQENVHECIDLGQVKMSSGVYWSLLLQPVDDTLTKFRRVGMALIYPRGLKTIESDVKAFEII